MRPLFLILFLTAFTVSCNQNKETRKWVVQAPAGSEYLKVNKQGKTILPNGRFIEPYGKTYTTAPHPFGLIMSPDGHIAVTANSGTSPLSVTILKNIFSQNPEIRQVPEGAYTDKGILASVFMGLAISPDNQILYVAGGQESVVYLFDINNGEKLGEIDCSEDHSHGYIGDMKLSKDGQRLYAVDQINFSLLVIDTQQHKVIERIPTGRYPFGLELSPDGKKAWVANVGMYEYSILPGMDRENLDSTAWDFPAYAYLSKESIDGMVKDSIEIPGLGDPNVPESFSVWGVDLKTNKVISKIKTGFLVGEEIEGIPAVGGASPNSVVATNQYVFVSNGNNDCVSVIDVAADSVVKNIFLSPDERLKTFRGVIPFGLCLSPDKKRLYVAESGINAIGVINVEALDVIGHIPAGWFPSKIGMSNDGQKLVVANAKGFGSGPNGGSTFTRGPEGSYIGGLMKGSVTVMDVPDDEMLKTLTQKVVDLNFRFMATDDLAFDWRKDNPIPLYPGQKTSPIKHIVFITKENRTYDEVFGQVKNGNGEAALARYGAQASFSNSDSSKVLTGVDVMPNHLALARQFAISDNFYVNADHSADGHRWLSGTYPNEWVETSIPAAYGGNRDMMPWSEAPGALAFEGASGAIYPEDYNEAGSIWEHFVRNNISMYNFGGGIMFAPHLAGNPKVYKKTGYKHIVNYPVSQALYDNTSRMYPTYNMAIPDQYRIDQFINEFNDKWINGQDTLPQALVVMLGADHGAGERPDAGFPFRESYMADNDLALGRLVEYLSHTPYWKNMAIIVTEDDSQGGVDHVDAHRSLLMVISPYANPNHVSHTHASFGSIFKTFWNILGTPYLNQYDASATDLADLFTSDPDFTPFDARGVDAHMFNPDTAYDPLDEEFDWAPMEDLPALDEMEFLIQDAREFDQKRQK